MDAYFSKKVSHFAVLHYIGEDGGDQTSAEFKTFK